MATATVDSVRGQGRVCTTESVSVSVSKKWDESVYCRTGFDSGGNVSVLFKLIKKPK